MLSTKPVPCTAVPHLSPEAPVTPQGEVRHGSRDSCSDGARRPAASLLRYYRRRNRNSLAPNPPPATPRLLGVWPWLQSSWLTAALEGSLGEEVSTGIWGHFRVTLLFI